MEKMVKKTPLPMEEIIKETLKWREKDLKMEEIVKKTPLTNGGCQKDTPYQWRKLPKRHTFASHIPIDSDNLRAPPLTYRVWPTGGWAQEYVFFSNFTI